LRIIYLHLYIFAILFTIFSCQTKQNKNTEKKVLKSVDVNHPGFAVADSIVKLMKSESDYLRCPGFAVTIIADSSILVREGYGLANKRTGKKIDENTVFRIASLSKSFAALTAKILETEGSFNFDDILTGYIPGLQFQNQKMNDSMTIRHILSMSTGLPTHSYTNLVEDNKSLDAIIPHFKSVKPIYPLGQNCTYQNASFGLIEKVIKQATGKSYNKQLKEKVFKPLQMKSTYNCDDFINYKNIAWPHTTSNSTTDSGYVIDNFNQKYYNLVSAGGINASITDLSKYLYFLINGDNHIISDTKRKELFKPQVNIMPENRSYESWPHTLSVHYAYGWRVINLKNGSKWIFHGGYVNRYQSLIVFNLEKKIGMSFLINSDCPVGSEVMKWFIGAVEGLSFEG
jgi:beta-lactamase class C